MFRSVVVYVVRLVSKRKPEFYTTGTTCSCPQLGVIRRAPHARAWVFGSWKEGPVLSAWVQHALPLPLLCMCSLQVCPYGAPISFQT